jgi:hypothetical protein
MKKLALTVIIKEKFIDHDPTKFIRTCNMFKGQYQEIHDPYLSTLNLYPPTPLNHDKIVCLFVTGIWKDI